MHTAATPTTPPATPPAIAPMFTLEEALTAVAEGASLVDDALKPVEDSVAAVAEDVEDDGGAVISVWLVALYNCAAVALKMSPVVTSKNAQAGMAVPVGIGSGNLD